VLQSHDSTVGNSVQSPRPGERWPDWAVGVSGSSPLGTPYQYCVPLRPSGTKLHDEKWARNARSLRFLLQAGARELLPDHRVAWCLRRLLPDTDEVKIKYSDERQKAYYSGLMTCSRLWECPVCSGRITEQRRKELLQIIQDVPYALAMGTFTISHHQGESCSTVIDQLNSSYRRFTSGRGYQAIKEKFQIVGSLRAHETTHGQNGWHPHLHVLYFLESVLTPSRKLDFDSTCSRRWADLVRAKTDTYASLDNGFELTVGRENLGKYITKLSADTAWMSERWSVVDEVTKYPVKKARQGGRTLHQLLFDYTVNDDAQAGELWREGVLALAGRNHLSPSRGLWKLLDRDAKLLMDDEEAAREHELPSDRVLAALTVKAWRLICREGKRGELLDVASSGSEQAVIDFLAELGVLVSVDAAGAIGEVFLPDELVQKAQAFNQRRWTITDDWEVVEIKNE